jgi:hypothetical protein
VGVAAGALIVALGGGAGPASGAAQLKLTKEQQRTLSGFASFELGQAGASNEAQATHPPARFRTVSRSSTAAPTAPSSSVSGCPTKFASNVNVSQNCLNITDPDLQGRAQAQNETAIAQDPNDPGQIVAAYNDYRRGDGTCGQDMSSNAGASWTDVTTPNGFVRGTNFGGVAREYFQAGGDPSVAWDTKGNAYLGCQVFMRGPGVTNNPDLSSAIYVFRSTGNGGASWNFPGHPVVETFNSNPAVLTDKPYMTVDNHVGSPFQDRIYVTWTQYAADGTAYIYEAHSSDYGETFSSPVVVSTTSATLCVNTFGAATPQGTCNNNQFSQPFTGPDGSLYVLFDNYNNATANATDNHNQVLLVKSTDGGQTFSAPVKVSDFNDLPDCATYQGGQDFGRACVPEKGSSQNSVFRAANYAVGGVNPTNAQQVVVTVASYINTDSNPSNGCVPNGTSAADGANLYTGVKTPGACNNKIVYSVSNDGGASFTGGTTSVASLPVVNQAPGQATTDQFWQWAAFTGSGKLVVSYFDRQYGDDETTGSSDISLSTSSGLTTFKTKRVTSSSMPVPTQFPDSQGNSLFYGDYSGLSVGGNTGHPLWMDTRNADLFLCPGTATTGVPPAICADTEPSGIEANAQKIYTASVGLP